MRSMNRGDGGSRRLICCRGDEKVTKCRVFSTEAPETLLNGDAPGPLPVLSVKKESKADLFEVVSDDLLTLNKNLQSMSYLLCCFFIWFCVTGVRIKTGVGRGRFVKDIYVKGSTMHTMKWAFWMMGYYGSHLDDKWNPNAIPVI
ncbi:putative pectin lyase/virulence factor [Helianthus anomalus]